jgi:2-deoxy-D-gluconate 3-dehydrogenase
MWISPTWTWWRWETCGEPIFTGNGKTALVTGANTGIGQAIALAMAPRRRARCLRRTSILCRDRERRFDDGRELLLDFSDPMAARGCVSPMIRSISWSTMPASSAATTRSISARATGTMVLDVNLKAVFFTCQAFGQARLLRATEQGASSTSRLFCRCRAGSGLPSYTASKHGVAGITKLLANEWAAKGINVNAIAPGYIATNNTEALIRDEASQQGDPRADSRRALGRARRYRRDGGVPGVAGGEIHSWCHPDRRRRLACALISSKDCAGSEIEQPLAQGSFISVWGPFSGLWRRSISKMRSYLSGGDWGIIGVSLQSAGTRDKLAGQDFVYNVVTQNNRRDESHRTVEIMQRCAGRA